MKTNRFKTIDERETFLASQLRAAATEFSILRPGAPVIVGVSGGRDSVCLVHLLKLYRESYEPGLRVILATVVSGVEPIDLDVLTPWAQSTGFEFRVIEAREIAEELAPDGSKRACYVCSRRRRRRLCELARETGASEIALGHHRLDFLETFLISAFRGGRLGSMAPRQPLFDGLLQIVRPMVFVDDVHLDALVRQRELPVSKSNCPFGHDGERVRYRNLLNRLERETRGIKNSLFAALRDPACTPLLTPDHDKSCRDRAEGDAAQCRESS